MYHWKASVVNAIARCTRLHSIEQQYMQGHTVVALSAVLHRYPLLRALYLVSSRIDANAVARLSDALSDCRQGLVPSFFPKKQDQWFLSVGVRRCETARDGVRWRETA